MHMRKIKVIIYNYKNKVPFFQTHRKFPVIQSPKANSYRQYRNATGIHNTQKLIVACRVVVQNVCFLC